MFLPNCTWVEIKETNKLKRYKGVYNTCSLEGQVFLIEPGNYTPGEVVKIRGILNTSNVQIALLDKEEIKKKNETVNKKDKLKGYSQFFFK